MKIIALRGFFVETGVKIRKGDVVDLPDNEANYLIDFKAAREATKQDEENFLNSDQVVSFCGGILHMGIRKIDRDGVDEANQNKPLNIKDWP
jgi:hypothetical protein